MKKYDVYHYDIWGAHHSVVSANSKEEIYNQAKRMGYKKKDVEVFEKR